MDPFSIVAGCVGLLTALNEVAEFVRSFSRKVREARSDVFELSRQLLLLRLVVQSLQDELISDAASRATLTPDIVHHINQSIESCSRLFMQIKELLGKFEDGNLRRRIAWAHHGQTDSKKLCAKLDGHHRALDLALKTILL